MIRSGDVIRVGTSLFKLLSGQDREATYYEEVRKLVLTDGLTGAINRRAFDRELERAWYDASRYCRAFSLVMLDIDHFKRVNDTWGHASGDRVLARIARAIEGARRFSDVFCRFGGEEFALLLPSTLLEPACVVAERLRRAIAEEAIVLDAGPIRVTVSLGVACSDEGIESARQLLERADGRLYEAKRSGRNRVRPSPGTDPA